MEELKVNAEPRTNEGVKGALSAIRGQKKVPSVIYGGDKAPMSISIGQKDIVNVLKAGGSSLIKLQLPESEETVIIKSIQYNVITSEPLHIDFIRVSMSEKIDVKIHTKLVGVAPGVKEHGAIVEHVGREVEISCLPTDIPKLIEVDISTLNVGMSITAKDLKLPGGVELAAGEADKMIVHLVVPRQEAEPTPATEGEKAEGAEPEVIAKGKKEEGEEGKEAAPKADGKAQEKK
jgi:large subunit ribosomal protein L25